MYTITDTGFWKVKNNKFKFLKKTKFILIRIWAVADSFDHLNNFMTGLIKMGCIAFIVGEENYVLIKCA